MDTNPPGLTVASRVSCTGWVPRLYLACEWPLPVCPCRSSWQLWSTGPDGCFWKSFNGIISIPADTEPESLYSLTRGSLLLCICLNLQVLIGENVWILTLKHTVQYKFFNQSSPLKRRVFLVCLVRTRLFRNDLLERLDSWTTSQNVFRRGEEWRPSSSHKPGWSFQAHSPLI